MRIPTLMLCAALLSCEQPRSSPAKDESPPQTNAMEHRYPEVMDPEKVGTYPALAKAGGGYVWDEVLEYRVWCYLENGASDELEGDDYFYSFATYSEAKRFADATKGAESPLALVLQREYIDESKPGEYRHIMEERVTEWPVEFLKRPRRTPTTIPDFLAPDAPANRLEILRGTASP